MRIYLIGYRCTGKTTIGKRLASHHKIEFMDTDEWVQADARQTIARIVKKNGWDFFRDLEKKALKNCQKMTDAVISTGGGIVLNPENREMIRSSGICIWLSANEDTIIARMNNDDATSDMRPSLTDTDLLQETRQLIHQRTPMYEQTHHIKVDTTNHSPDECIQIINRRIKDVRF